MDHALTAVPALLVDGQPVVSDVDHTLFLHKHPRTAVGLSKERDRMWLVVVDGRQPGWSKGLRTDQVGLLLASYGAWSAANLDGGASSTLVVPSRGGLVNDPCFKKGDERSVPNHLGIVRAGGGVKAKLARLLDPVRLLAVLL
jgi:exopolysaccharide biosynthesis protein